MNITPPTKVISVRQVVLACMMAGAATAYALLGHAPGWQIYLAVVILATMFLISALLKWAGSDWVGLLALAVLLIAMVYQRSRPASIVTALMLVALSAYRLYDRTASRPLIRRRRRRFRRGDRRF